MKWKYYEKERNEHKKIHWDNAISYWLFYHRIYYWTPIKEAIIKPYQWRGWRRATLNKDFAWDYYNDNLKWQMSKQLYSYYLKKWKKPKEIQMKYLNVLK